MFSNLEMIVNYHMSSLSHELHKFSRKKELICVNLYNSQQKS